MPKFLLSLLSKSRWIIGLIESWPWLNIWLSRIFINKYSYSAPPRPRPVSLFNDYASWVSVTDRSYTGRHLPPVHKAYLDSLPPVDDVRKLFERREKQVDATDTSVLFMFFAQWFTDSFLRTGFKDPRTNTSTHEIDLCQIYGLTEAKTAMLRSRQGGRLKSQVIDGREFPPFLFEATASGLAIKAEFEGLHLQQVLDHVLKDVTPEQKSTVFAVGLEHGNATIGYSVLNTLFLREHNRVAGAIAAANPDWDNERLFQTTRNVLIVLMLKLVVEEYIRHVGPVDFPLKIVPGIADRERWGKTNWISIEFNVLYRWHSLVPDMVKIRGAEARKDVIQNNNALVIKTDIGPLCDDLSRSKAGKIGLFNTPIWLAFGRDPTDPTRESVEKRTIDLTRFVKLQPYNEYRKHFGLKPCGSFEDLTKDERVRASLKALYGSIDRLELYPGLFAEDYDDELMMGELLTTMVAYDAFTQALTNPLLGVNVFNRETFSEVGMEIIANTRSLKQILDRNTSGGPYICQFRSV